MLHVVDRYTENHFQLFNFVLLVDDHNGFPLG
jgi:hypothetical protein